MLHERCATDIDSFMRDQDRKLAQKDDLMKSMHLPKEEESKAVSNLSRSQVIKGSNYEKRFGGRGPPSLVIGKIKQIDWSPKPSSTQEKTGLQQVYLTVWIDILHVSIY